MTYRERIMLMICIGLLLLKPVVDVANGDLWPIKSYFIYRVVRLFLEIRQELFRRKEDAGI